MIASKFMTGIHNHQRRNATVGFGVLEFKLIDTRITLHFFSFG